MGEIENLSFEEAFAELEEVVRKLEAGDLTLDQAMAIFERGMALAEYCNARLDTAELRVKQLVPSVSGHPMDEDYELVSFEEHPPD